jgi:hypothetical protein
MDLLESINRQLAGWATFYQVHQLYSDLVSQAGSRRLLEVRTLAGA